MRRHALLFILLVAVQNSCFCFTVYTNRVKKETGMRAGAEGSGREKIRFNDNWNYHDGGGGALDALMQKGQNTGKPVTLPHDASVGKPRDGKAVNGSGNGFL